jgi:hypothetical protein
MDLSALQSLLASLTGARVACVGDLMVDRFVYGEVARVSAEAPIPVMARTGEDVMLGAAGNVARNVAALGGMAALVPTLRRTRRPGCWAWKRASRAPWSPIRPGRPRSRRASSPGDNSSCASTMSRSSRSPAKRSRPWCVR